MDPRTQKELNDIIRALQGLSDTAKRDTDRVLREAAGPLRAAVAGRAPRSDKPHKRYNTPKVSRSLRAPKGMGRVVATYQPGNLSKSFRVLSFRRARFAKFVGPGFDKTGAGRKPDGYYAHMVNFDTANVDGSRRSGAHFVEAAVSAAGPVALNIATRLMKQTVDQYARSKGLQ
ncbi:MAG: hypothetical protein KDC61_05735 [Saprospiraceae bacterium]|nr:hypothetical protein [Saprospiraceae bacterium]